MVKASRASRQAAGNRAGADIPGDMAQQFAVGKSEAAETARQTPAAMIDGDEKGRRPGLALHGEDRRFVVGQQLHVLRIHRCPVRSASRFETPIFHYSARAACQSGNIC